MCGILGLVHAHPPTPKQATDAIAKIARRGPDHTQNLQITEDTWFAHARLSIIDLSVSGNQPYQFEHLFITFNGVIYNYKELRETLRKSGYDFVSSSDTEVLIKAWHYWGERALQNLDGFFSFAIYDTQKKTSYICRDNVGKKPLYWRHWQDGIAFASRLDAIEAITQKERIQTEAIQWLFYLKYIPEPLTALTNIFKLERGHCLMFNSDGIHIYEWAHLDTADKRDQRTTPATKQTIKSSIERAVDARLTADVPVSCLLSGGIDSSIVAMIAARKQKLDSFTLAISSHKNSQQFDESAIARKTANIIGSNHHEIRLDEDAILDVITPLFATILDEPLADPAAILNHHIFSKVSQSYKVCLTGDGADELFGGYRRHRGHVISQSPLLNNPITKPLAKLFGQIVPDRRDSWYMEHLRIARRYLMTVGNAASGCHHWFTNDDIVASNFTNSLNHKSEFAKKVAGLRLAKLGLDPINTMLALEIALTIPNQMMVKIDRTSMDLGVEVRSPFLDQSVIADVFSVPGHKKVGMKQGKMILREIFQDDLPDHVLEQKKRGFDLPVKEWLDGPLQQYLQSAMDEEFHAAIGIKTETVRAWLRSSAQRGSHVASSHLWTLLGIKIWFDSRQSS
jgi:asparagine synthase (glutamine-hydrolysing)